MAFPKTKGVLVIGDDGGRLTGEANIFWSFVLQQQVVGGLARFDNIAGHDDRHVGQALHGKQIFQRLMGRAVGTNGDSTVGSGDHHVEIAIADGGTNLVEIAGGGEGGVGSEHGQLPFPRQSGRGGGGGLLGDAHADPAFLALRLAGIKIADSN